MTRKNRLFIAIFAILFIIPLNAQYFNSNLTEDEKKIISSGEIYIKNINFHKYMCLNKGINANGDYLIEEIKELSPKYLAEVIQIKKYEGNEDLPQRLEALLNNVSDYAGIPYYSERAEAWYDLYTSAEIVNSKTEGNKTTIDAVFVMEPFDVVNEKIIMMNDNDSILYIATNQNKLRYLDKFDCIWPKKMKICILLFRDGDNWVLYGIGGVNAPRIPLFTERIQTSFINRINTFCSFIFKKLG